jgi:glycosyltransferase involved in cell wall biosynthesis
MRVLGLVHQYVPVRSAGAEAHVHAMLRALAGRGHQVDVVLNRQGGDPYTFEGVSVWPVVDERSDVNRWLGQADIIVAHLENTTRATVLGEMNDIPVVIAHHNTFEPTRDALGLAYSRTDLVVTNSQWMDEDLIDWAIAQDYQLPPRVVVRPVADPVMYTTTPGDRVTLVNLRRLDPGSRDGLTKGGEVFRAVAERLPKVQFLGVTGVYGIQQELDDLPNVEVLPHVPHDRIVGDVYARTKLLLVPSSYESWGRVAAEAICSGIPVIASPTPGLSECLGSAGVYIDPGDIDGWVGAIQTLLKPKFWRLASAEAKMRAAELAELGRDDLERFCRAVEATAAARGPVYNVEAMA